MSLIQRIFFSIFIFSSAAFAEGELYEWYTSLRALGMGNAYSAVADDKDALYYNPGALTQVRGFRFTIANLKAGANSQEMYTKAQDMQDQNKYIETIRSLYGKNLWAQASGYSFISAPGFSMAAFDKIDIGAFFSNPVAPKVDMTYINDYGFSIGGAAEVIPNISLGAQISYIRRTGVVAPIGVSVLGSLSADELKKQINNTGVGYNGSVGLLAVLPNVSRPRVSLVFKNLGATNFTRDTGTNSLGSLENEIVFGLATDIPLGPFGKITTSADYKYFNLTNEQLGKKIHLGAELNLLVLSVRGGFNQGYYTAGVGLDLKFLKFDAATYGVELGEYPGQMEDRRYVASITIELAFDGGLFSNSSQGKNSGDKGGHGGPRSGIKPRR